MLTVHHQLPTTNSQLLAWHGWRLSVPDDWNPVKVEGDAGAGLLLLADLERPRLGVRWKSLSPKADAHAWALRSITEEIGALAAAESRPTNDPAWRGGLLYTEPDPPGRDVFAAVSAATGRGVQIVHHTRHRQGSDRRFADEILAHLSDTPADQPREWSIFDLTCRSPAGWRLQWYRFHAGDVTLAFARRDRTRVVLRQIGPATLALSRQPLEAWIKQLDKPTSKLYRPPTATTPIAITLRTQPLRGLTTILRRRKRLFWAVFTRDQTRLAVHDEPRNRLLIAQSDDEAAARTFLSTVGRGADQ